MRAYHPSSKSNISRRTMRWHEYESQSQSLHLVTNNLEMEAWVEEKESRRGRQQK